MKKLYLLLAVVAVAATSCQKDVVENIPCNDPMTEEPCSPYAVSKEEALDKLYNELALIDGKTTRANDRRVRKIEPVRYDKLAPATRSTVADVEDLLYIVEFEDGKGSAILGADKRVEGVFAVLDEGVITAEDFDNAANGVATDELNTYLAGLIADEAIEQMSARVILPEEELRYNDWDYDTTSYVYRVPLMLTRWSIFDDFSRYCKGKFNRQVDADPLAVAAAQMILYNTPPAYHITIGGETFNVSTLMTIHHGNNIPNAVYEYSIDEVARFIAAVSRELQIDYTDNNPIGYIENLVSLLNRLGYHNVQLINNINQNINNCFDTHVSSMLLTQEAPFVMEGQNEDLTERWHWVVDGYKKMVVNHYWVLYVQSGREISRELVKTVTDRKVHANFGYGGYLNGYYSFGIFDWSTERTGDDLHPEFGDIPCSFDEDYSHNLKMIIYEL